MKCKNVISLIKGNFIIKVKGEEHKFENKEKVNENIKNYDVTSINVKENMIVIEAKFNKNIKTLEELGYSFEAGVSGQ